MMAIDDVTKGLEAWNPPKLGDIICEQLPWRENRIKMSSKCFCLVLIGMANIYLVQTEGDIYELSVQKCIYFRHLLVGQLGCVRHNIEKGLKKPFYKEILSP